MRLLLSRLPWLASGPAGLVLLVLSWLWLFSGVLAWLVSLPFAHPNYRAGALVFCGLAAVIAARLWRRRPPDLAFARSREVPPAAAALLLGAAAAYVVSDHLLQLHILSALLLGLSAYGLLGLCLPRAAWRRGLAPALLLCAVLPFGAHGSNLIGLFARLLTARIVEKLLAALHVGALSSQTILILENGIAHIDAPCSGLRSLWAGLLFVLGATWLLQRRVGLRWLLALLLSGGLFLSANVGRVLLLVLVGFTLRRPGLAEVLHVPAGVLGFLLAAGGSLLLLYHLPKDNVDVNADADVDDHVDVYGGRLRLRLRLRGSIVPLLCLALGALALVHGHLPRPHITNPAPLLPASLSPQRLPLSAAEETLFGRFGARAEKWRVALGPAAGSLLLVSTSAFRAQHPPELCLAAAGLAIERSERILIQPGAVPVRLLGLRRGQAPLSAAYFFQSRTLTTPDFLERLWASLRHGERRWVMASLLLDAPVRPDDPALHALLGAIHGAIALGLQGVSQ
jgi:exosortase O